jgi:hypothetical protein
MDGNRKNPRKWQNVRKVQLIKRETDSVYTVNVHHAWVNVVQGQPKKSKPWF